MGIFSLLFLGSLTAGQLCIDAQRLLTQATTKAYESQAYPSVRKLLLDFIELEGPPSPSFLKTFDLLFSSWGDVSPRALAPNDNLRSLRRIHPAFRLPPALLKDLIESTGKILDHAQQTGNPGIAQGVEQALISMATFAKQSQPDGNFLTQRANEPLINIWYEIKAAAWFLEQGFQLIWFRKRFFLPDLDQRGEIDLLIRDSDGKVSLVEVKSRLHRPKNYGEQFDRYSRILSGEISLGIEVDEILIVVPQGFSEHEENILKSRWPNFKIGSFDSTTN